jgi:hypothetical protein
MQKLFASKWVKVYFLFFVVTLPLFLGGCGTSHPEPTYGIAGSWNIVTTGGTVAELGGSGVFTFTTSSTDNSIGGTTPLLATISGSVSDVNVSFSWVGTDNATNSYTGTVSPLGGTFIMSGTWTSTNGQSGIWNAILENNATPVSYNITGNWNMVTTGGTVGEQQGLFAFTWPGLGYGIAGTTTSPPGLTITGIISSYTIMFSWTGSDGATYIYYGTVSGPGSTAGNTMTGTWTKWTSGTVQSSPQQWSATSR